MVSFLSHIRPKPSTVLDLVRRAPGLCACAAYLYMGRSCQKLLKDLHFECEGVADPKRKIWLLPSTGSLISFADEMLVLVTG